MDKKIKVVNKEKRKTFPRWTAAEIQFLTDNYPEKGKGWCSEQMGKTESQIRTRASMLGLKANHESDFSKDWKARGAQTRTGRKRPEQALVMKRLIKEGKINNPTKEQCVKISERVKEWYSNHEHPRGMLGKTHSAKSKEKMSESGIKRWERMSSKEYEEYCFRASVIGQNTNPINRNGASWKAGWREIGGKKKYFRSRWEANYARYLEWLKVSGNILEWDHETKTFWFEGIKRGCMSYLPDFEVTELGGAIEFHEVKGWMDDRSKTKIKRMAKYHSEVVLKVIDANCYKKLERQISGLIDGWEK